MASFYTFEDLSGTTANDSPNPYNNLINSCNDSAKEITSRYATHRLTRAAQQTSHLLSPSFTSVTTDSILTCLLTDPTFTDPRNCLVFWARPPPAVKALIALIQTRLQALVPRLWLMPQDNLHMTALEITHSQTAPEVAEIVAALAPIAKQVVDWPRTHRARLVRPMVTFDAQALAVSLLPDEEGGYTYHHLRRDLYEVCSGKVEVRSRYVVPSAHLTVARYVDAGEWETGPGERMRAVVEEVERVNQWLREEFWPDAEGRVKQGGDWVVGEGKGLDMRMGTLWYGGGETVMLGEGFEREGL